MGSIADESVTGIWSGSSDLQEFYPRVFITNAFGARNLRKLKERKITHILICGSFLEPSFPDLFAYKQLELEDNATEAQKRKLSRQLTEALQFIHDAIADPNTAVMIHCGGGRSRSGAVAAAYLMREEGLSTSDAIAKLKKLRPIVEPNRAFVEALQENEESLKKSKGLVN